MFWTDGAQNPHPAVAAERVRGKSRAAYCVHGALNYVFEVRFRTTPDQLRTSLMGANRKGRLQPDRAGSSLAAFECLRQKTDIRSVPDFCTKNIDAGPQTTDWPEIRELRPIGAVTRRSEHAENRKFVDN